VSVGLVGLDPHPSNCSAPADAEAREAQEPAPIDGGARREEIAVQAAEVVWSS
jgi:hypothetical protein